MAVYFVTGKLGSGKTLCAVGKIRDYLETGRAVATNLDLNLDNLLPKKSLQYVTRLPDKPRIEDMEMLGKGCVEEDESKYGAIVLDELGTWFNTRNWNDKSRLSLLDWFLHARKMHWDIFFIVQDIDSVDKQLKKSLCEHLVVCKRTDRLSVPLIGPLLKFMGFDKVLPKIHIAKVFYGDSESAISVGRWWYRGKDLYQAYDTAQVFTDDNVLLGDQFVDFRASRTLLSPFFITGEQLKAKLQKQIDDITSESNKAANPASRLSGMVGQGLGTVSMLAICIVLLGYRYLSPDDEIIKTVEATPAQEEIVLPDSFQNPLEIIAPVSFDVIERKKTGDFFLDLIDGADVSIGMWHQNDARLNAMFLVKREKQPVESLTLDDLRVLGWVATKRGDFIMLHKEGLKEVLTYKIG